MTTIGNQVALAEHVDAEQHQKIRWIKVTSRVQINTCNKAARLQTYLRVSLSLTHTHFTTNPLILAVQPRQIRACRPESHHNLFKLLRSISFTSFSYETLLKTQQHHGTLQYRLKRKVQPLQERPNQTTPPLNTQKGMILPNHSHSWRVVSPRYYLSFYSFRAPHIPTSIEAQPIFIPIPSRGFPQHESFPEIPLSTLLPPPYHVPINSPETTAR